MQPWAQAVLVMCAVALTAALVAVILALRQTVRRAERILAIVELELRPLIGQMHALTEDVRTLTQEASHEMEQVVEVTGQVRAAAEGVGRVVNGLAGFARAGQLVGLLAGVKRGVDVFLHRLTREQGDHHG